MALNAASSIDAQQHQLSLRSNYDDDCLFKNSMSFKNEKRLMLLNYVCPIEQFDKEEKINKKFILSKQIASIFQIDK